MQYLLLKYIRTFHVCMYGKVLGCTNGCTNVLISTTGRIPLYFRNSYNKLSKYILVLLLKWDPPEYSAAAPGPGVTTHMLVVSAKLSRSISRDCTEFGFSFRPRLKLGASRERASSLWSMVVEAAPFFCSPAFPAHNPQHSIHLDRVVHYFPISMILAPPKPDSVSRLS